VALRAASHRPPGGIAAGGEFLMPMMIEASSYPFLNILWTILIFFALVIWIWMVIMVLIDIFSRPDISGWGKAGWIVLIIVLPFVGVLCYLIAYSAGISERRA
jgi:Phospholipase_D-nuclease N-terminal